MNSNSRSHSRIVVIEEEIAVVAVVVAEKIRSRRDEEKRVLVVSDSYRNKSSFSFKLSILLLSSICTDDSRLSIDVVIYLVLHFVCITGGGELYSCRKITSLITKRKKRGSGRQGGWWIPMEGSTAI